MKRWNGWGDSAIAFPLAESVIPYLTSVIGEGQRIPDASLDEVIAAIPDSRVPDHPLITPEPMDRLTHARGQSLPDWIALRSGRIGSYPDGISYPSTDDQVSELIDFAYKNQVRLIPYGGGTSVVGHINPLPGETPILTIDLSQLNKFLEFNEVNRLATFGAGARGPHIESQLNKIGYTLGHFPQSFEYSTLGGWIATRSSGQQSYYYGRIEDLFAGGHIETPIGPLELPTIPASAAGPDIRHFILGSEGRIGIITRAAVRIRPLPSSEAFYGVFFRNWDAGVNAVKKLARTTLAISMLRLSDARETETTLILSGKERLIEWANRGLKLFSYGPGKCLLIFGVTGDYQSVKWAKRHALSIIRKCGGLSTGRTIGNIWEKSRFTTPYLRNTLWERGYAVDTLETAMNWSVINQAAFDIMHTMENALEHLNERILVFSHLSHMYTDGASVYITYIFRRSRDPDETLQRWSLIKEAASYKIIEHLGTISHQHGVGYDHAPYLENEKSKTGISALSCLMHHFDPESLLNPGKLISQE